MGGDRGDLAWEAVEKHLRCCTLHIGLLVRHAMMTLLHIITSLLQKDGGGSN